VKKSGKVTYGPRWRNPRKPGRVYLIDRNEQLRRTIQIEGAAELGRGEIRDLYQAPSQEKKAVKGPIQLVVRGAAVHMVG